VIRAALQHLRSDRWRDIRARAGIGGKEMAAQHFTCLAKRAERLVPRVDREWTEQTLGLVHRLLHGVHVLDHDGAVESSRRRSQ
jgi:hypothetical protein